MEDLTKFVMTLAFFMMLLGLNAQQIMRINKSDGTTVEIALDDIQKLTFNNQITGQLQNPIVQQLLKMKLYPNPARDYVNVNYTLPTDGIVTIEFLTLNGTLTESISLGRQIAGEYKYSWHSAAVLPGAYICIIKQNHEAVVQKVIVK